MQYKYPRTPHLSWSPGATNDDKTLSDTKHFEGKKVVITEKLDGENTTIAYNHIHARSLDSKDHPSRHWVKAMYSFTASTLEKHTRICGENVYAQHSIAYENLDSYFYAFSVWRKHLCLSWETTISFLDLHNIITAPVIYIGIWNEDLCKSIKLGPTEKGEVEGYVVRLADSFDYNDFDKSVAKFVRANHVQTDEHWLHKEVIPNKLKK